MTDVANVIADEEVEERFDVVPKLTDYTPHEKQAQAHKAFLVDGFKRGTLFWGRQVGKSLWSVKHLEMAATLKQGQYFIVFRTHKHAKDVMWRQYLNAIPKEMIAETNSTELIITFNHLKGAFFIPGKGWVAIKHDKDKPPSTIQLLGSDYALEHTGRFAQGMIFDEYQDQNPQNWETVYKHYFTTTKGWACFMGTARGYNHWYDRLQFAKKRFRDYCEGTAKATWFYLEATWRDNKVIDPTYMEEQRAEAEETGQLDTWLQEVELQFRTIAGAVYPMFDRKIHVVSPNDHRIPQDGTLFVTWDFGWVEGHPTAVNFIDIDSSGKRWCWDEIHGIEIPLEDVVEMIKLKTSGRKITGVIGDSARPDLIEAARKLGLPMIPAPKKQGSKQSGIVLLGTKLKPKIQILGKPEPDYYFTENCTKTIYQMENYRYPEAKVDRPVSEEPIKKDDDHPDGIRYLELHIKFGLVKDQAPIKSTPKFNQYGLL